MRRAERCFLLVFVALALVATSCGDDTVDPAVADLIINDATTAPPSTTTSPLTTASPTTTVASTSTTESPEGMCGDLIPVVTDEGTTCVDPDATTTTTEAADLEWPGESFAVGAVPPLLVANATEIVMVVFDDEDTSEVTAVLTTANPVLDLRQASDGSIFTLEQIPGVDGFPDLEVARYRLDGTRTLVQSARWLYDVAVIDGHETVIVSLEVDEFGTTELTAIALDDPLVPHFNLGAASDHEFGVGNIDVHDGLVVASASADLTEVVYYVATGAGGVPKWSPTDELPYAEPPFVTGASWSPDGQELVWAEGPDWGWIEDEGEFGPIAREWRIRSAALSNGEISLDWPITASTRDTSEMMVDSILDFGSHIVVNRSSFQGDHSIHLEPWVIDFTVEEPGEWTVPVAGIATAVVFGG